MSKIEIINLTKNFGSTVALDEVSLSLEENKIYGLLGRNGAGKSTLLNLLTNKLAPTHGKILVDGKPVYENYSVLSKIYFMSEQKLYPSSSKVKRMFKWTKEFYSDFDLDYANELASKFDLDTNKKIKALSTGYHSIFKAILTLASNAEIMLFDEPVLGLDANHRDLLYKEIIANYSEKPKTMIISTHLIEEIADILEEVVIIKKGKVILHQSTEELLANSHTVSGEITKVDQYLNGKVWALNETMHNFKSAIVTSGKKDEQLANSLGLDLNSVDLQKLFIGITSA